MDPFSASSVYLQWLDAHRYLHKAFSLDQQTSFSRVCRLNGRELGLGSNLQLPTNCFSMSSMGVAAACLVLFWATSSYCSLQDWNCSASMLSKGSSASGAIRSPNTASSISFIVTWAE
uniref:Uncharacterized protein n=1 Tax=Anguilla anguilla TaxID=7936 RepID=A0A0E9XSK5_ANGAN